MTFVSIRRSANAANNASYFEEPVMIPSSRNNRPAARIPSRLTGEGAAQGVGGRASFDGLWADEWSPAASAVAGVFGAAPSAENGEAVLGIGFIRDNWGVSPAAHAGWTDSGLPVSSRAAEILFVDPAVPDLATLLAGVRPEVETVVLDAARPAARQIADALAGRRGLEAVHVVAHGAPGRVSFASGEWSAATLKDEAEHFKAIGRALGEDGNLRLWSCRTGEGAQGRALVNEFSRAAGAKVAAARGLVGATALGGAWELEAPPCRAARPPLTPSGIAAYACVLNNSVSAPAGLSYVAITFPATILAGSGTTGPASMVFLENSAGAIVGSVDIPDDVAGTEVVPIDLASASTVTVFTSGYAGNGVFTVQPGALDLISAYSPRGSSR